MTLRFPQDCDMTDEMFTAEVLARVASRTASQDDAAWLVERVEVLTEERDALLTKGLSL